MGILSRNARFPQPGGAAPEEPGIFTELGKGFRSGLRSAGGQLHSAAGGVAEAVGADGFARQHYADAQQLEQEAQRIGPRLTNFRDIRTDEGMGAFVKDAWDYGSGLIGSSAPVSAAAVGGALLTRGRGPGLRAAMRGAGGSTAAMTPFMTGEAIQRQQADPEVQQHDAGRRLATALGTGIAQAGVESVVPTALAHQITRPFVRGAGRAGLRETAARNLADIPLESAAETAGTAIQQQGVGLLNPGRDTSGDREELLQAAVGGGVAGAGFAGAGATVDAVRGRLARTDAAIDEMGAPREAAQTPQIDAGTPIDGGEGSVQPEIEIAGFPSPREAWEASQRFARGAWEDLKADPHAARVGERVNEFLRTPLRDRARRANEMIDAALADSNLPPETREQLRAMKDRAGQRAVQAYAATLAFGRDLVEKARPKSPREAYDDAVGRLRESLRPETLADDADLDTVAQGGELVDPMEFINLTPEQGVERLRQADEGAVEKVRRWGEEVLARARDSELRARVKAAMNDLDDIGNRAFIASQRQAQRAGDWFNEKLDEINARLRTSRSDFVEGGLDGPGTIDGDDLVTAKRSMQSVELPPESEAFRQVLQDTVVPVIERRFPGLTADADRINRLGEVLRTTIVRMFDERKFDPTTVAFLDSAFGEQLPDVLREIHKATYDQKDPQQLKRFFERLNELEKARQDEGDLKQFVRQHLTPEGRRIADTERAVSRLIDGLRRFYFERGSALQEGRVLKEEADFEVTRIRRELGVLFGDNADVIAARFEQEYKPSRKPTREEIDEAYESQERDKLQDGDMDMQFFGGAGTKWNRRPGGKRELKYIPSPEAHRAQYGNDDSQANRMIRELQERFPDRRVRFMPAEEYEQVEQLPSTGMGASAGVIVVEGMPAESEQLTRTDVLKMRADANYAKSPSRIEVGEVPVLDKNGKQKKGKDGQPLTETLVLDAQKITNEMHRRLEWNESDEISAMHRRGRAFMVGIAAVQEQLGMRFSVPPETVAFRLGKRPVTVEEIRELKFSTETSSGRGDPDNVESLGSMKRRLEYLLDLYEDLKDARGPDGPQIIARLTQLANETYEAVKGLPKDLRGQLVVHRKELGRLKRFREMPRDEWQKEIDRVRERGKALLEAVENAARDQGIEDLKLEQGRREIGPDEEIHLAEAGSEDEIQRRVDASGQEFEHTPDVRKGLVTQKDKDGKVVRQHLSETGKLVLRERAGRMKRSATARMREAGAMLEDLAERFDELPMHAQTEIYGMTGWTVDKDNQSVSWSLPANERVALIERVHQQLESRAAESRRAPRPVGKSSVSEHADVGFDQLVTELQQGAKNREHVERMVGALVRQYAPDMPIEVVEHDRPGARGNLRVYPDGRFALSIDTKANAATVASTVAHEFGHALQFHLFNKAPQAVQDRVRGEWRDLVQKYRTDDSLTAEDFIRDFGSVGKFLDQKSAPSTLKRMTAKEYMQRLTDAAFAVRGDIEYAANYPTSFEEYFANQFQKYITSGVAKDVPAEVRSFWQQAIATMREFFDKVIKTIEPKTEFKAWVESLAQRPAAIEPESSPSAPLSKQETTARQREILVRAKAGDPLLAQQIERATDAKMLQRMLDFLNGQPEEEVNQNVLATIGDLDLRLSELVRNHEDIAYGLQTKKFSLKPTTGGTMSAADRKAIKDYIDKTLGPTVRLVFDDKLGYAGEFVTGERIQDTIRLSTLSLDPMSAAYHESLHAFIKQLRDSGNRQVADVLVKAASTSHVTKQLRKLLANEPDALKQLDDAEERAAYMYQFWAAGKLVINNAEGRTALQKFFDFFREILGIWTNADAVRVLEYFNSGEYVKNRADRSAVARVLEGENKASALKAVKQARETLNQLSDGVLSIGHVRLRETGIPALHTLADRVKRQYTDRAYSDDPGFIPAARLQRTQWMNRLGNVLRNVEQKDIDRALAALQSGDPTRYTALAKDVRQILDDLFDYMRVAGVAVSDLGYGKNYFPRVWDDALIAKNERAFRNMLEKYVHQGDLTPAQVDGIVMRLMAGQGGEINIETTRPGMMHLKHRKLDFISPEDAAPFQRKNLALILDNYITQATRRAEWARRFKDDGSGLAKLMKQAQKEGATQAELDVAEDYLKGIDGTLGDTINPNTRRLMGNLIVYQNIRLLPLAIFSSIVDPMGIMVRGGTLGDAWNAFKRGVAEIPSGFRKNPQRDEAYRIAELVGTIDNEVLTSTLGQLYSQGMVGDKARKLNDTFFKYNMMEQFNRSMRVAATQAAMNFIVRHAADPSPHSERWMNELGLVPADVRTENGRLVFDAPTLVKLGMKEEEATQTAARIQTAINTWVDGAVLRPDAADRPIWFNDPRFVLVSHLKQFTYSFHQTILKRVAHEVANGNYTPAYALLSYVPIMIASDLLKGLIQGGGELPEWKKNWTVGDYVWSGVQRGGLLGVHQFTYDALVDVQRGGVGVGALVGPTFEQGLDAVQVAGGRRQFGSFVLNSLPANGVYKHWDSPNESRDLVRDR